MLKKTKNKIIAILGVVGSIASIIGFLFFFLPSNNSGNKYINELYPNIILDYYGAGTGKIKDDFGTPFNEYQTIDGENKILYKLNNGTIQFGGGIKINSYDDVNIILPDFYNRGKGYKNIIFGKSTFKDVCDNYPVNRITSSWGSLNEAKYTEIEYYTGNFGQYKTYTFGTLYSNGEIFELGESYIYIEDNKDILGKCKNYSDIKFDYIEIN